MKKLLLGIGAFLNFAIVLGFSAFKPSVYADGVPFCPVKTFGTVDVNRINLDMDGRSTYLLILKDLSRGYKSISTSDLKSPNDGKKQQVLFQIYNSNGNFSYQLVAVKNNDGTWTAKFNSYWGYNGVYVVQSTLNGCTIYRENNKFGDPAQNVMWIRY